jgi:hypothetical protein
MSDLGNNSLDSASLDSANLDSASLEQQLDDLMERAFALPTGAAQTELLSQAVRLSDALGDLDIGFRVRILLIDSTDWGRPDIGLVAFSWCLAQYDRDPERFEDWQDGLLWRYKGILTDLRHFPQIPRTRIEQAFEDFRARLEQAGEPPTTYDECWLRYCMASGHREAANKTFQVFKKRSGATGMDCRACQLQREVEYAVFVGDDAGAVKHAQTLLSPRSPRCNRVPHVTHAELLLPLLRLGDTEGAAQHHLEYRKIMKDRAFGFVTAQHLEYLGYLGDLGAGLKLLERHLGWAYDTFDLAERFELLRATLPLLVRLRAKCEQSIKLRLERSVPFWRGDGLYPLADFGEQIRTDLQALAAQFDARNGNSHFSDRTEPDHALIERFPALEAAPKLSKTKKAKALA